MNGWEISKIRGMLRSWEDGSDKILALKGETWLLRGMNSPYASHQQVVINTGHSVPRCIVLYRSNYYDQGLVVLPYSFVAEADANWHEGISFVSFPSFIIRKAIFQGSRGIITSDWLPEWLTWKDLITLAVVNNCEGFDGDGNPKLTGRFFLDLKIDESSTRYVIPDLCIRYHKDLTGDYPEGYNPLTGEYEPQGTELIEEEVEE